MSQADPDGALDVEALSAGVQRELPSYAQPLFLRVITGEDESAALTSTFKKIRRHLRDEGYDVTRINGGDDVYHRPADNRAGAWTYRKLTVDEYQCLQGGRLQGSKL